MQKSVRFLVLAFAFVLVMAYAPDAFAQTSSTPEASSTYLYNYVYGTLRWPLSSAVLGALFVAAFFGHVGRKLLVGGAAIVIAFAFLPFWLQLARAMTGS